MLQGNVSVSEAETETYRIRNGMPTEDRGSHKKRRVKKRRNIQQTGYQIRNNRQNTILWKSELDEERTIPQNSIQRLCTWNQKEGKAKETMDRHDQRGLQRTASDTHDATCRTQDRRVWRATIDERVTRAMASPGP